MFIRGTMERKQPRRRRSFTPEFKAEIVERCRAGDRTIGQVARDFDLTGLEDDDLLIVCRLKPTIPIRKKCVMNKPEPPSSSSSKSSLFLVGRDSHGHWVVQDQGHRRADQLLTFRNRPFEARSRD